MGSVNNVKAKTKKMQSLSYYDQLKVFVDRNFDACMAVVEGTGNPEVAKVVSRSMHVHVAAGNFAVKAQKMGSAQTLLGLPLPKAVEPDAVAK